jgi:hypothetical protein
MKLRTSNEIGDTRWRLKVFTSVVHSSKYRSVFFLTKLLRAHKISKVGRRIPAYHTSIRISNRKLTCSKENNRLKVVLGRQAGEPYPTSLSPAYKHNRPLWVAVQGPNRPTPYTSPAYGVLHSPPNKESHHVEHSHDTPRKAVNSANGIPHTGHCTTPR